MELAKIFFLYRLNTTMMETDLIWRRHYFVADLLMAIIGRDWSKMVSLNKMWSTHGRYSIKTRALGFMPDTTCSNLSHAKIRVNRNKQPYWANMEPLHFKNVWLVCYIIELNNIPMHSLTYEILDRKLYELSSSSLAHQDLMFYY